MQSSLDSDSHFIPAILKLTDEMTHFACAFILGLIFQLCLCGAAAYCRAETTGDLIRNQQERKGFYVEEERQEWEILNTGKEARSKHFIKYRIFNDKGWKTLLPVFIHYGWNFKIENVEIELLEGSAKPEKIREKDLLDLPAYAGFELYSDRRVLIFSKACTAQEGSLAISFELEETSPVLSRLFQVQYAVPVSRGVLAITAPGGWTIAPFWPNGRPEGEMHSSPNVYSWTAKEIAPLLEEKFAPPLPELALQVGIRCLSPVNDLETLSFADWQSVSGWFLRLYETQIGLTPAIREQTSKLVQDAGSRREKIQSVYDYVREQVRYVAVEIGQGNFQPHPVGLTFEKKYGDCKDKAALLCAMLGSLDVTAWPVLVRTRGMGQLLRDFPNPYQFNHCIAYIPPSEFLEDSAGAETLPEATKEGLFLDATAPLCPFGEVPPEDQATWALIVDRNGGRLSRIPGKGPQPNSVIRITQVELEPDGRAECLAVEKYYGIENQLIRREIFGVKNDERLQLLSRKVNDFYPRSKCGRLSIENEGNPVLPLEIKIEFSLQKYAQRTGALLIFPASYWKMFPENPFIEETRQNPIQISYERTETDSIYVTLPVGYTAEKLPDPATSAEPFGEFEVSFKAVDSRTILIVRSCRLIGNEISSSQYVMFRDFIARMMEKEAENVVLTRL